MILMTPHPNRYEVNSGLHLASVKENNQQSITKFRDHKLEFEILFEISLMLTQSSKLNSLVENAQILMQDEELSWCSRGRRSKGDLRLPYQPEVGTQVYRSYQCPRNSSARVKGANWFALSNSGGHFLCGERPSHTGIQRKSKFSPGGAEFMGRGIVEAELVMITPI